jgi:hypothetical protein
VIFGERYLQMKIKKRTIFIVLILIVIGILIVGYNELAGINYPMFSLIVKNPSKTDYYVKVIPVDIRNNNVITAFIQEQFIVPHEASKAESNLLLQIGHKYRPDNVMFLVILWKMENKQIVNKKPYVIKVFYNPNMKHFDYSEIGHIDIEKDNTPE